MSSYRNYYDSTFGRRADSAGKSSQPSRIATKYGGSYTSNITGPRIKTFLDKDTHPPVSYKSPLSRSSTRSRDPSPSLDKSEKSSSSSYLSPNRLYPRSKSRESTLSPTSSTTNLPRLTTKKEPTKYKTSREDLAGTAPKYLSSRFLPKNSVERSLTAYSRPSTIRTHEVSRKNKELLGALHAQQEQEKLSSSRSTSRCSSLAPEEVPKKPNKKPSPEVELETIKVCTRGTSPTLGSATQPSFLRSRRMELAKTIEKTITRPKTKRENMVDKEMQSDRLDDSTKSSRFAGASRISATPWTNFLDMKFNSPKKDNDSPKSLSRASSTKSIASIKSDKETKKPLKSKLTPPKQLTDKKQLPPPIPKSESSSSKSLSTPNKDFRKSVLNMNPKKLGRRSNSGSSADSDNADPDATDVSENLNSCTSSLAKLEPQRSRRSPSSDVSTTGSEDEKSKRMVSGKNEAEAKNFLMRALAPVTNLFKGTNRQSVADNSDSENKVVWILDPSSENPSSSEPKSAKIVLHRLEADQQGWWDEKSDISSELQQLSEPANVKYGEDLQVYSGYNAENNMTAPLNQKLSRIKPVDSGEKAWWLDENAAAPEGVQTWKEKPKIQHISSGEKPWWIEENPKEIPENVKVWNPETKTYQDSGENAWWMDEESEKQKIRPVESGEAPWWIKKDSTPPEGVETYPDWVPPEPIETHKLRHIDSGERAWWLNDDEPPIKDNKSPIKDKDNKPKFPIRHQDSGEKAWWLEEFDNQPEPLGDRASPEGLEMPKEAEASGRLSPYDNVPINKKRVQKLFISKHKNIDDLLGGTGLLWSPLMNKIFGYDKEECREVDAREVIIHEGTGAGARRDPGTSYGKLDDAALQLYKDGDYGAYLDLEASISEQQEEFEGFHSNKKNSIVLRTQLSVRVHTIIEKLLTSEGRELRRALFSLKQIFQEDKDLVHEFVQNDGLSCLIKVGSEADQNYQNYILRALGQVMLYVDGMNGVMDHNQTIQWLYSLISSKFRLVVKTALKLLLVFVEYTDSNCMLLVKAVNSVDYSLGLLPYNNIMKLLKDFDSADTELLIYATTLINKVLNGVPDQDTYYDQADALEEQGMESVIQRYMSKPGTDLDLLQQFQIYEAVLQYEDGEELSSGMPIRHLDENLRKTLRSRKSITDNSERRKSRRHSTGNTPLYGGFIQKNNNHILQEDFDESSSSSEVNNSQLNGSYKDSNKGHYTNALQQRLTNGNNLLNKTPSRKDMTPYLNAMNKLDSEEKQPWIMSMIQNQEAVEESDERNNMINLKKENTVKDITQKLANQSILQSPTEEKSNRFGDMCGLISKAKEGLAKSKSKADVMRSPTNENLPKIEIKKSENELRWEELVANLNRPLNLCDMDFTDLASDDETDILAPAAPLNGIPPPPPPLQNMNNAPPPPPLASKIPTAPPPVPNTPLFSSRSNNNNKNLIETKIPIKKNKKTVKLFWKEVRDDPISHTKLKTGYIWDELSPVCVDTQKLEHLFESRAKDLISKKQQELNKNKEIIVLDPKRSNAINIGMTKLPPPRSIKTAILKMDATIMNREGIEKLLTMLPTEEERTKIQEAQAANPDLPLGSAEQFLLTLASISELPARLKLWAFKLDFENLEREIAEPLMDLKQGFEVLKINKTFKAILSTLLSIGNFLNGNEVKGFQIEYLTKVPEVKDTVHKHSLLHHLCHIVMEKFPEVSDLYSEIGAITRASKVDFEELALNIQRLQADCKASWDYLKLIAKHDGSTMMKVKMSDFLADCAERIILLGIIHRRIMNRFHKFLLWLGIPFHQVADTKPNEFCRIVSEFALEYRTTRERVLQQLEKKANHRERNKTRGKMITDIGKFRSKEDRADAELRQLLGSDISDVESMQGTLPWRHRRRESTNQTNTLGRNSIIGPNGHLTDGDDEILESLVKTATKGPRTAPRERKRTRHADRKSFKRSRTRENNPYGSRDSP